MDDDEYLSLIRGLETQLRAIGAHAIADETRYLSEDYEAGHRRLLPPRQRLIEMLRAFNRWLSIQDVATYRSALGNLRESIEGGEAPAKAVVAPLTDTAADLPIDLSSAPDLAELRAKVDRLIAGL